MSFDLAAAQDKVAVRLFDNIGTTVVYSNYAQTSTNNYGDELSTYGTSSSILVVPYSLMSKRGTYQPFGDMQEGDMDMVFKFDQTVNVKDRVTLLGTTYQVRNVEDFPIANGLLAKVARVTKNF
jgi:hypothetical protein